MSAAPLFCCTLCQDAAVALDDALQPTLGGLCICLRCWAYETGSEWGALRQPLRGLVRAVVAGVAPLPAPDWAELGEPLPPDE